MSVAAMESFYDALAHSAARDVVLAVYGPFNYNGSYTSASNAQFDQWLKQRDPHSGIRDFECVNGLAGAAGFSLQGDHSMPANNRLLVWQRTT
ncbi:MAG: DUF938 domain-containing protein [Halioglobus sp.]